MVMVARDGHIGSRLKAMVVIPGAWWVGSVCGGFTICLARACGGAYVTALCLLTALGVAFFSILRTKADPGSGILSSLGYLISILTGEFTWPARVMWRQIVVNQILIGLIAALGCLVGGTLLLPSLATDELREVLADIIQTCGYSISGYASRIFPPEQGCSSVHEAEQRMTSTRKALQDHMEFDAEKVTDTDYMSFLSATTSADSDKKSRGLKQQPIPSASSIRPLLLKASGLLQEAALEPPFLLRHRVALGKWKPVLDSLEDVVLQTSAMESVLEGQDSGPLLQDSDVQALLGSNVLPVFRLLHAEVAAATAVLAKNIRLATGHHPPRHISFEPAWAILEHELAAQIHITMKQYFHKLKEMEPDNAFRPNTLVRAILYIATLTTGIMEAVTNVDHAVAAALSTRHHPHSPANSTTTSARKLRVQAAILLPVREALKTLHESQDCAWKGSQRYLFASTSYNTLPVTPKADPASSDTARLTNSADSQARPGMTAKAWQRLKEDTAWMWPLIKFLLGSASFMVWWAALRHWLPHMCSSRKQFWRTLRLNRYLQYGIKFWFGTSAVMALCLSLSADVPAIQAWRPLYLILTVIIVCSQKVDTTLSKGVLRIAASVIGGTYGYLVMLGSPVASNPYAVMCFVSLFTFVAALAALSTFKYAVFLMLVTAYSLILCQYRPNIPGFHGTVHIFYDRLVDITIGVLVVLLLDLILPWYVSSASLETLGQAFKDSTLLMQRNYEIFYEELKLSCYQPEDQGSELKAFSANLSNGTLDKPESGEASSMQKRQSSTSHSGLHSQNSALSWSQRQQLRRTSAAMRHASASRQLPHEENRVPPGRVVPFRLVCTCQINKVARKWPSAGPLDFGSGAWDQVELTIQRSSQLADHASGHTHHGQPQDTSTPSQSLQHGQLQHVLPASLQDLHQQEQSKELREQHNMSAPPNGHLQGLNGQTQPPNGRIPASNGQNQTSNGHRPTSGGQQSSLRGAGSQPVLLQTQSADQPQVQHSHLRQGERPGPDLEQGLEPALSPWQGHGATPAQPRRQTAEEEAGEKVAPGGLGKGAEEKLRGLSRLEEDALEAKVAGPIGQVQISLIAEAVLWKRGILVMPPIVNQLVKAMQVLLDRLAAQELMLLQRPVISGRYSGSPFVNMLSGPLDEALRPMFDQLVHLGELVCCLLSEESHSNADQLAQVDSVLHSIEAQRQVIRQVYLAKQKRYHIALLENDTAFPFITSRTSDDSVRFLSVFFALSKALDKAVLLARTACNDPWIQQQANQRSWTQFRLWFGR
ncbi:MAG: hypothetical protein FRX49_05488 [Trebouxia sp. A1-2]|nr:MAG: hypothetical protein FRX49_05488 [Trebouxia sp. A1-2]